MRQAIVTTFMMITACRSDTPKATPDPANSIDKAAMDITRPHPAMSSIRGGTFVGREKECFEGTLTPRHPENEYPTDSKQEVASFRIDRQVTPCADYDRCVAAGACKKRDEFREPCEEGAAVVMRDSGDRFCKWRGARLPKYAEWQRAARSTDGRVFPMGDEWEPAACPTLNGDIAPSSCKFTSPDGLEYHLYDSENELTGDDDCQAGAHPPIVRKPMMVETTTRWLSQMFAHDVPGKFRCALDGLGNGATEGSGGR